MRKTLARLLLGASLGPGLWAGVAAAQAADYPMVPYYYPAPYPQPYCPVPPGTYPQPGFIPGMVAPGGMPGPYVPSAPQPGFIPGMAPGMVAPGAMPVPYVPSAPAVTPSPAAPGSTLPRTTPPSTQPSTSQPSTQPSTSQPSTTQPSTSQPNTQPDTAQQNTQPQQQDAAQQQGTSTSQTQDTSAQQQQTSDLSAALAGATGDAGASGGGEGGPGAGEGGAAMIGRADYLGRFNMFDLMAAQPQTRVWFGTQYMDMYDLQRLAPQVDANGVRYEQRQQPQNLTLYRMGAEIKLGCAVSVAFQHQYMHFATAEGLAPLDSSWGSPLIMLKWAFYRSECLVMSAVAGVQPETSVSRNEARDMSSRWYPGLLTYRKLSECWFYQGGVQFGVPVNGTAPATFDFALSLGYWLYHNKNCDSCCSKPWLIGIVPQVEMLAQHVIGNTIIRNIAEESPTPLLPEGVFGEQQRNVYDMTFGIQFLFRHLALGVGYSRPITGAVIRNNELIASAQYRF